MNKTRRLYELITPTVFFVISLILLFQANKNKRTSSSGMMAAMDFPKLIIYCILILSTFLIIKNLISSKEDLKENFLRPDSRVFITAGLIVLYAVSWKFFSFLISTFIYVAVQGKIIDKNRKFKQCLLIGIIITVSIHLIFSRLFHVRFPEVALSLLGIRL